MGGTVSLIGCAVLIGWVVGIEWVRTIVPGWATMKANTSLAMVFLGMSLLGLAVRTSGRRWGTVAPLLAVPPLLIGVLTLLEHIGLTIPDLDVLLANAPPTAYPSGRMSPVTAIMISLLSAAYLIASPKRDRGVTVLIAAACTLGVTTLAGYCFGAGSLYQSKGFETVAAHTALCAVLLSVGLLLVRPQLGPMHAMLADSAAGASLRACLPLAGLALSANGIVMAVLFRFEVLSASAALGLGLMVEVFLLALAFGYSASIVNRMADAAAEAGRTVAESEARFRTIWDAAPVLVWMCDEQLRGEFFNKGWLGFVGGSPADQAGQGWMEAVHPSDRGTLKAAINRLLQQGEPVRLESRVRRFDGQYRWLMLSAVCTPGAPGISKSGCVGTCVDITESKLDTERQSLLMRELDHRVKNNLAAVASVADLTFLSTTDSEAFRAAFQGRLLAMARAHSALAAGRWTGLGLDQLLRTVLDPILRLETNPVLMNGPPVHVPQQAVPPLAMALHELTTNAQKYGALSVAGGRVRVEWFVDRSHDGSLATRIEWTETGGPVPRPDPTPGLGTQLLHGLIESELAGTLETDYRPSGLFCRIVYRADAWQPVGSGARNVTTVRPEVAALLEQAT
jgi:PAS domain S-box-containing protein